jgi:predicted regulator of Ras-like GTPase activity (Roadblock/LC7/MglB family)
VAAHRLVSGSRQTVYHRETGVREQLVTSVLRELIASSEDIEGSALISMDGLLLVSLLPAEFVQERVAAMSAAMLALGSQATAELRRGELDQILIKSQGGYVLLTRASPDTVLVVITGPEAKLGTTFIDVRRGAQALARAI